MNKVSFSLPFCPPSVNSLYSIHYQAVNPADRVKLRPECLTWKTQAKSYIPMFKVAPLSIIRIDRTYAYQWFTKKGTWAKRDSFNMDKLLFDVVSERTGIDDRRFKAGKLIPILSDREYCVITLIEITFEEWSQECIVGAPLLPEIQLV